MLTFFIWGWFYVTFGPFLKQLYALNTITFGAYSAIIETIGDGIAMIAYVYFGLFGTNRYHGHFPSNGPTPSSKTGKTSKTPRRRFSSMETEFVLFLSSIALFMSFLLLTMMLHIPSMEYVLQTNQIVVGVVLTLYFVGHEGCVIGLMILHVEVVPILQQPRASGILSMISCVMVFISQSVIIGPLSSKYYEASFETECIALLIFSGILMVVIGALTLLMHHSRSGSENRNPAGSNPPKRVNVPTAPRIPEHGQSALINAHPFPPRYSKRARATVNTPINGKRHLTPTYTLPYGPSTTDFVFDKKKVHGRRR